MSSFPELKTHIITADTNCSGLEVIKVEVILKPQIKGNDWLLADKCPQAAKS